RIALTAPLREALRKGGIPELIEKLRARYKRDRRGPSGVMPQLVTAEVGEGSAKEIAHHDNGAAVASLPGGTFYLVRDGGPAVVLNDKHPFYGKLYAGLGPNSQ